MSEYFAAFGVEAIAASTAYVLIDLSDTTNYPHTETDAITLDRLRIHCEKASDGVYDIWIGVVIENDATDGTAQWIHAFHLESVHNATDSTDRFATELEFPDGLNLKVSNGSLVSILTNSQQADSSNWQNDTGLLSPAGAGGGSTGRPGVGDLVVWVEEVSGTGTIDLWIGAHYRTI